LSLDADEDLRLIQREEQVKEMTHNLINQSINQKHLLGRQLPMNTGAVQVT